MKSVPIRSIKGLCGDDSYLGEFTIRKVEDLLLRGKTEHPLHRHDFYFVLAFKKGSGKHSIDFVSLPVNNHSIFFMRPGQVHELLIQQNSTGYILQFSKEFIHSFHSKSKLILNKISRQKLYNLPLETLDKTFNKLQTIFEESHKKESQYIEVIKANLELLFIDLYRQQKEFPTTLNNKEQHKQEQLEQLLELLENHILTHKQVSEYANMMHLTPYQINNITKNRLGKNCSELIIDHILLEAKRQLLATSKQVNEIAYYLGYEDSSYFIRLFKKHTGYSPNIFRENYG